jgi:hypothetical protein
MFCFYDKDAALKSKYGCLGIGLDRYLDTAALEDYKSRFRYNEYNGHKTSG